MTWVAVPDFVLDQHFRRADALQLRDNIAAVRAFPGAIWLGGNPNMLYASVLDPPEQEGVWQDAEGAIPIDIDGTNVNGAFYELWFMGQYPEGTTERLAWARLWNLTTEQETVRQRIVHIVSGAPNTCVYVAGGQNPTSGTNRQSILFAFELGVHRYIPQVMAEKDAGPLGFTAWGFQLVQR